jgi:tetratricopeptide (TPR) repeat protein
MPLGLELAASWAGLLPLSEIAAELEQSLDLLATEHHDIPLRHRSMEAALGASWRRLAPEQKRAFKGLTVFRGGFTRMAAAEVAGATLPLLVTLVNKSWLTYDRQEDRYHIHELLRQYGAGKLSADPAQEQEVRKKHSTYFCGYLQKREADWFGPRQQEAAAEIRDEIDNIQPAWRWAANDRNEVLLEQGLNSLCHFYYWEGRLKDGELACGLADKALSSSTVEQQGDSERLLALLSQVLAWESDFVHDVARKEELLGQSQKLLDRAAQKGRDTRTEQAFLFLYKSYAASLTDLEQAIRFASLGLEIFHDLNNRIGEAETLRVIGDNQLFQGNHALSNAFLHNALNLSKQLGDSRGMADTLASLGMAARHIGDYQSAEAFLRQSVTLYRRTGNRYYEESRLVALSIVLTWAGKFLAARETVEEAIEIARDLGQYPDPWPLNALTVATFHPGNYRDARAVAVESLELARQKGVLLEAGWALENLGEISFVMGDIEQAKEYLEESVAIMEALGHIYKTLALAALGYVFRALGEIGPARHSLQSALRVGVKKQSISPILLCLPAAALLAADADRPERALELYSLARQFGYIRNSRWFADVACRELDEVRASLAAEKAAEAAARGREMDVWETAETLLRELNGGWQ